MGTIGYFIMDSLENQLSWGVIQIYSFPQWNLSYIQLYLIYCWPFGMRPLFIIYINAFENNRSMHCTLFCQKNKFPLGMNNEAITNKFECVGKMTSLIPLSVLYVFRKCVWMQKIMFLYKHAFTTNKRLIHGVYCFENSRNKLELKT